jgi:uncharacterized protein YbcI
MHMHTLPEEHDHHASREGAGAERGQLLADIANAVVRIHKRFYGKGPTKARAYLSQELLTVVLEGGYTRGERTLQQSGHEGEVLRSRIAMQRSTEEVFCETVEAILDRSVRSFMSANDPAADLQVEIFVLDRTRRPERELSRLGARDGLRSQPGARWVEGAA